MALTWVKIGNLKGPKGDVGPQGVVAWKATTAYAAGQTVISPAGDPVTAKTGFTSGATYDPSKWNPSTQDGRIAAIESKNTTQDGRIADVESKNTTQDGRIAAVESKNTTQDARLDTAVFNGDPRIAEVLLAEELAFGVLDKDGHRTWIEAGLDGKPTARAGSLVGDSVGVERRDAEQLSFAVLDTAGRRTELELDQSGQISARVLTQWASRMSATTTAVTALPTDDWAHWGDSLTDERVTGTDGWVTKLSAMTGKNHYNGGWYGQKAGEIAARQGGLPSAVTLPSNTIPASGSVTVTAIRNSPVEVHATLGVYGTLAGVHGFMQEPTTDVTTFTRDTPGDPVACPPGTRFIADDAAAMRNRTVTIWAGRNDIFTTDPQIVVAAIRAQIDYLSPSVKRVMVLEVPPSTTSPNTYPQLLAMNTAIKAAFPAEWTPVATWLRTTDAATAAGITFTAQDNTDIANGVTPESFRLDTLHLNAAGCTAVAQYIRTKAQERGWLA